MVPIIRTHTVYQNQRHHKKKFTDKKKRYMRASPLYALSPSLPPILPLSFALSLYLSRSLARSRAIYDMESGFKTQV